MEKEKSSIEENKNSSKENTGKGEGKEAVKEEKKMQLLKKGDYSVHVLIEEVRNLVGKDNEAKVYPMVKITCLGKEKRTNKLSEGCFDYTFTEHFYFERNNMSVEELDSEKIVIEVIDSKNSSREDYLGIYEFDFTYVYSADKHAIHNQWIALANPESKDITKVRGFLKMSISVLNEHDERVELNYKTTDDPNSLCVVPPQVKMEYMQVSLYIFKAEQLPDMDAIISKNKVNRECNGFIYAKYLGTEVKTTVKDMVNDKIVWNEVMEIPINVPVVSQRIVLQVWDKDAFSNDIVGSFELSISDIIAGRYSNYQYIHIYGAPLDKVGKYTNKMNANPEIGSLWKGRILLKIDCVKTDNPKKSCKPISDQKILSEAGKLGRPNQWFFDIFLYDALFLPKESDNFSIHVGIEEHLYKFTKKKAEKRNISYNQSTTIQLQTLTNNIKEVSDFFIYLVNNSGDAICFQRISAETLLNNTDTLVIKLLPDPSIGKIDEFVYSGLVKIKIHMRGKDVKPSVIESAMQGINAGINSGINTVTNTITNTLPLTTTPVEEESSSSEEEGGLSSEMNKIHKEIKQKKQIQTGSNTITSSTAISPDKKEYMIVANIHMSRYLIAGDSDGTSDPYVKIVINQQEQKTTTRYDSVNCIWNECLYFSNVQMNVEDKSTWPILFLQVMDEDNFHDDMLAYNYIWLSDSTYSICSDTLPTMTPQWHQLHLPLSNRPQGQILLSFLIINMSNTNLISLARNLNITPETELYSCEINVLGLRDLQPLSILPVKKAYITFDMNSINVSGKEDKNLKSIKTQPKKSGPNPTINTVIKFDIKLPKNRIFMPDMQCVVYDYVLSGLLNHMLGVFVLPLNDIIGECESRINRDLKVTHQKLGLFLMGQPSKGIKGFLGGVGDSGSINNNTDNVFSGMIKENLEDKKLDTNTNNTFSFENSDRENKDKAILLSKGNEGTGVVNAEKKGMYNILQDDRDDVVLDVPGVNKSKGMLVDTDPRNIILKVEDNTNNNKINQDNSTVKKNQIVPIGNLTKPADLVNTIMNDKKQTSIKFMEPLIMPVYKKYVIPGSNPNKPGYRDFEIEDESQAPNPEFYEAVGYNKYKQDEKKHYRLRFNCELENVKDLNIKSPFFKIPIRRGKFVDKTEETGIFEAITDKNTKILKRFSDNKKKNTNNITKIEEINLKEISQNSQEESNKFFDGKQYGDFKGLIRIVEKNKLKQYEEVIESVRKRDENLLLSDFRYLNNYEELSKRILVEKEVVCRIYILKLGDLAKKDLFSESDPFLKLYLGDNVVDESKNFQEDKANCSWCKSYDLTTVLPGDGMLKVEVWDYDPLFSDELIGYTYIDLEDRFFDRKWREMKEKPIEKRMLHHPDLEGSQGWVSLWVDVYEKKHRADVKKWDISPPPTVELEMRLIVWETEGTPCMDVEGMSDYYVVCFLDSDKKQSTDMHYRCEKGKKASFNWRIVLPVTAPRDNTLLNIQVMDNDFFSRDDYVSGAVLNIQKLINDVYALDVPIKFNQDFFNGLNEGNIGNKDNKKKEIEFVDKDKFWLNLYRQGDQGGVEKGGRVQLSLEILPSWKAQICKVGKGRDEPNINPYLPPPIGRFEWSLNPFKMLNQCVGPEYRRKIYLALCCGAVILYVIFVVPYMLLHLSGEIVNPFNYIKKVI